MQYTLFLVEKPTKSTVSTHCWINKRNFAG